VLGKPQLIAGVFVARGGELLHRIEYRLVFSQPEWLDLG
jgi:hypothetical protein